MFLGTAWRVRDIGVKRNTPTHELFRHIIRCFFCDLVRKWGPPGQDNCQNGVLYYKVVTTGPIFLTDPQGWVTYPSKVTHYGSVEQETFAGKVSKLARDSC
jgi:hypothetical protein